MVLTLRKMSLCKFLVVSVFSNNNPWQKTKTWKKRKPGKNENLEKTKTWKKRKPGKAKTTQKAS